MSILEQLLHALTTSRFSQAEIAKRADVSTMTVWRIVNGERKPSLEMAEKLARAAGRELRLK